MPARTEKKLQLRYLLFVDEAPLYGRIDGAAGFAKWFQQQGPITKDGRSLRQLDLKSRLFKHRLSYLIYSRSFAHLPDDVKTRLLRQLWLVLTDQHPSDDFKFMPSDERRAILRIMLTTMPELPDYWRGRP